MADFVVSRHVNGRDWVAHEEFGKWEKVTKTKKEAAKKVHGRAQTVADETGEVQEIHVWNGDGTDYQRRLVEPSW